MTTSLTTRAPAAAVPAPTPPGATPSACWPATGSTCRRSRVALEERNFHILDLLIGLTKQMVEGELLQMEKLGRLINEEEYFDLDLAQDGVPVPRVHAAGRDLGGH
jgi:hypothetical protein